MRAPFVAGRVPERQDGDSSAELSAERGEPRPAPEVVEHDQGCGCTGASSTGTKAATDRDAPAQDTFGV